MTKSSRDGRSSYGRVLCNLSYLAAQPAAAADAPRAATRLSGRSVSLPDAVFERRIEMDIQEIFKRLHDKVYGILRSQVNRKGQRSDGKDVLERQ